MKINNEPRRWGKWVKNDASLKNFRYDILGFKWETHRMFGFSRSYTYLKGPKRKIYKIWLSLAFHNLTMKSDRSRSRRQHFKVAYFRLQEDKHVCKLKCQENWNCNNNWPKSILCANYRIFDIPSCSLRLESRLWLSLCIYPHDMTVVHFTLSLIPESLTTESRYVVQHHYRTYRHTFMAASSEAEKIIS